MVSIAKPIARRELTTLYRLYGQDGALLYIGITQNLTNRMKGHARFKRWWDDVTSTTVEAFPTWTEAHAIEIQAIRAERPRYNFHHTEAAHAVRGPQAIRTRRAIRAPRTAQVPAAKQDRVSKILADVFASLVPLQDDTTDVSPTLF